jgi:levansucrase
MLGWKTRVAVATMVVVAQGCADDGDVIAPAGPGGASGDGPVATVTTTLWTADQVRGIRLNASNTIPASRGEGKILMPTQHNWDFWPVTTPDNRQAQLNGFKVYVGLSAPRTVLSGQRHDIARLRYAISRDGGETYQDMGDIFPVEGASGSRQWAGSTMYDPATRTIYVFYTATGRKGEQITPGNGCGSGCVNRPGQNEPNYDQVIMLATARLTADSSTVRFEGWQHRQIMQADGVIYKPATGKDEAGTVRAFRDPSYFRDPNTGRVYLTFMARWTGPSDQTYDSCIGMAVATSDDLTQWRLLPPVLSSPGVNNELERPSIVYANGRYHLFIATHIEKFKPPLVAPEALYGWVSSRLGGPYTPLNGTALVASNPPEHPYMHYSWIVQNDFTTVANVNYYDVNGLDIGAFPATREFDQRSWGGIMAPRLQLGITGTTSRILGTQPAFRVAGAR